MTGQEAGPFLGRLGSRVVGWYPDRWLRRYGDEVRAVLEQHEVTVRTVLDLLVGAVGTHLDPAYRWEGVALARQRGSVRRVGWTLYFGFFGVVLLLPLILKVANDREPPSGVSVQWLDAAAVSPDRHLLLTSNGVDAAAHGVSSLWNVGDPAHPQDLGNIGDGAPTAFRPDGRLIAARSDDALGLWAVTDSSAPVEVATLRGPGRARGVAFAPDGRHLTASYAHGILVWDVSRPRRPRVVASLAAQVMPPSSGTPLSNGYVPPSMQNVVAYAPNGRTVSVVTRDTVTVLDVATPRRPRVVATLRADSLVDQLAYSPDGRWLAAVDEADHVVVWPVVQPAARRTLSISPTVDATGPVRELFLGALNVGFTDGGQTLTAVAFVPDPRPNYTQMTVTRWRMSDLTRISSRTGTTLAAGVVAVLPTGNLVGGGNPDGSFQPTLWALPPP